MAKTVTRKNLKQFGVNGNSNNFGQFGSVNNATPTKTKDIDLIQALSAWLTGLQDEVVASNKAPFLEDINSVFYLFCWQMFYLLQEGIAEWDTNTTYFVGSRVRKPGTSFVYASLTDDNLGNALPSSGDNTNWHQVYPVRFSDLTESIGITQIPDNFITSAKIISLVGSKLTNNSVDESKISSVLAAAVDGILGINQGGTGINIKMLDYAQWAGNGVNDRTVDFSMGAIPDIAFVWQIGGPNPVVLRVQSSGTNNSQFVSGGVARTDCIRGFSTDGLILGTHAAVNAIGSTYGGFIIKHQF